MRALLPFLKDVHTFAEPCCGDGHLVRRLERNGLKCVLQSDIVTGPDALTLHDFGRADCIITNPPWTRALLHPLIGHFQSHRPTWLLFDSDWAYNVGSASWLYHCSDIVAVGRLKWFTDTPHMGKDNVSWYRFWVYHRGGPKFHGRSPAYPPFPTREQVVRDRDVRMCPVCSKQSTVLETRLVEGQLRRRRQCHKCATRWWSIELPVERV